MRLKAAPPPRPYAGAHGKKLLRNIISDLDTREGKSAAATSPEHAHVLSRLTGTKQGRVIYMNRSAEAGLRMQAVAAPHGGAGAWPALPAPALAGRALLPVLIPVPG